MGHRSPSGIGLALLLTLAWIVCCTVVAQGAGWLVELARTTAGGVWAVRVLVAAAGLAAAAVAVSGRVTNALDDAPTRGWWERWSRPAPAARSVPGSRTSPR